ncbi:uncharacterized protein V6R79_001871 [Siganus canaliculatus]
MAVRALPRQLDGAGTSCQLQPEPISIWRSSEPAYAKPLWGRSQEAPFTFWDTGALRREREGKGEKAAATGRTHRAQKKRTLIETSAASLQTVYEEPPSAACVYQGSEMKPGLRRAGAPALQKITEATCSNLTGNLGQQQQQQQQQTFPALTEDAACLKSTNNFHVSSLKVCVGFDVGRWEKVLRSRRILLLYENQKCSRIRSAPSGFSPPDHICTGETGKWVNFELEPVMATGLQVIQVPPRRLTRPSLLGNPGADEARIGSTHVW